MAKPALESCVAGGRSNSARRALDLAIARAKAPTPVERIERTGERVEIKFPSDWRKQNGHPDSKPDRPPVFRTGWHAKD